MQNPTTLIKVSALGTIVVALCCFTPILVVLLAALGLSALTGYLDYVLLPALAIFIGLTLFAVLRKRRIDACQAPSASGEKK